MYKRIHPNNKFTPSEDEKLRSIVESNGSTMNWKAISKMMPGRNARQCKDRWEKFLSPELIVAPFTLEEDIQILKLYNEIGSKWVQISKLMKGRSDTSIKSRFQLLQRHNETLESLIEKKTDGPAKIENVPNNSLVSQLSVTSLDEFTDFDSFDEEFSSFEVGFDVF